MPAEKPRLNDEQVCYAILLALLALRPRSRDAAGEDDGSVNDVADAADILHVASTFDLRQYIADQRVKK